MTGSDFIDGALMISGLFLWMVVVIACVALVYDDLSGRRSNHHPDTLRIRCEDEQGGVLIGKVCIKKEAILWSEEKRRSND